ncbi:hypothetical protein K458DRAFT_183945 [Lentithecium fluviatile CBS 122367]|uniref:Uncharacterized protein n=1 Tax=Lentithecium fluviatile CBS 122367 TaxID=1168545 RepID=A0A6G1IE31_9PLEO|nr:hypothetical protein K458DRAFT_183945 [Lentithecium fluviatile CBS 122367]
MSDNEDFHSIHVHALKTTCLQFLMCSLLLSITHVCRWNAKTCILRLMARQYHDCLRDWNRGHQVTFRDVLIPRQSWGRSGGEGVQTPGI